MFEKVLNTPLHIGVIDSRGLSGILSHMYNGDFSQKESTALSRALVLEKFSF